MHAEVFSEFTVEAAHHLPDVPPGHPCGELHGHSYRIAIHVSGPVPPETGWVVDYADIGRAFESSVRQIDHRVLNDVPGLDNPTSENLARWIWEQLRPQLPDLCKVVVWETSATGCIYTGGGS